MTMITSPTKTQRPSVDTAARHGEPVWTQEQSLLRSLMANIPDHVYFKDRDSRFIAVSGSKARCNGMAPAAMVGKSDFDLFSAQHAQKAFADEQRIMQTGRPVINLEERETWPDGPDTWASTTKMPLKDPDGRIVGTFGISRDITERKRVEQALADSLSLFQATLESSADGLLVVNQTGQMVQFNQKFAEMWRIPAAIMASHDDSRAMALVLDQLKDPASFVAKVKELYAQPEAVSFDVLEFKDGRVFERHSQPQKVAGKGVGRVWVFRDITERKRAEEALQESEEKFRRLFESSQDAIMTIEPPSWKFTAGNPATLKMFGAKSEEEFLTHAPSELSPDRQPDGRSSAEKAKEMIATAVRKGSNFFAWTHRRIGGEEFPAEVLLTRMVQEEKVIVQATVRDITERNRAEEALRENEEKFRALADSAQNAIVVLDAEDQILFWNGAAERLFGYTKAEALGGRFHSLVVPERFREASAKGLAQFRKTGTGAAIGKVTEFAALRKDGTEFPVELSLSMVTLHQSYAAIGIVRDITERKRTEAALREAVEAAKANVRLKSAFLANMSHEIRTPLNGVMGMADLLLDTGLTPEQRSLANTVRTSADCLLTIINDILDFSKIEAGMLTFELRPFELRQPVEHCLQMMAERAHAKGLELAYLIDDSVPVQVIGDAGRLQQVLMNLVGNAVKFTERGEVVVRVTREGEASEGVRLRFTVTDTGIGIPPEARQGLFQPFSQADNSITRRFGGTGLGLAISRQLVELMGGAIGVDSEAGRGSTFWFTVKLALQPAALRVIPHKVDLAGQRALIVDDNKTNREILERQLTAWRVSTASAADGESALVLLRNAVQAGQPFDFALLDMQMPGMSGLELARHISADPALASLKMLVLTSMGSIPPFAETAAVGVAACLAKPVQQKDLQEAVVRLLGGGRPRLITPAAPPPPPTEFKPLRILLAEDNVVNQSVARLQLARMGYRVDIVADGRAALEAAQARPYDAVLMDCQMPEMDGYDATRQLRAWEQTRRAAGGKFAPLYIIAMTASAMAGDREACLAAGMDDYVSKPVQAGELAAAIARVTNRT